MPTNQQINKSTKPINKSTNQQIKAKPSQGKPSQQISEPTNQQINKAKQ